MSSKAAKTGKKMKKAVKKVEPARKPRRARTAPKKKYRMLKHGETIKSRDQWKSPAGGWHPVEYSIGEAYNFKDSGHYKTRREVKPRE
jgi:hypothetical protein